MSHKNSWVFLSILNMTQLTMNECKIIYFWMQKKKSIDFLIKKFHTKMICHIHKMKQN